jgi:tripartite-type tricarboxylate transporter receptor subunit TctC
MVSKHRSLRWFLITFLLSSGLLSGTGVSQENYPDRPITMVIPFSPGMYDTVNRVLCKAAEKELGQPIIVENKPGSIGVVGMSYVFRSTPDGYTLCPVATGTYIQYPFMMDVPYDPFKDITDICGVFKFSQGLAVKSDSPWKTFEDLIAYAKKNPGKFTYASSGIGGTQHIAMEWIAKKEGIRWRMVPFKSGGDAAMAALGGHTDGFVAGGGDIIPLVKAGKMRFLLGLNDFRWPDFPDVPNMAEKGYGFFALTYIGIAGPKGIPDAIRQKLENVFKVAVKDPTFLKVLKQNGLLPQFMSGEEFTEHWKSRYDEMKKLIMGLGLFKK